MAGIVVDTQRMHITKQEWRSLLEALSQVAKCQITELHTRDFYSGNGRFRNIPGSVRAEIIGNIFDWLRDRKHTVLYSAVDKRAYKEAFDQQRIPDELNTIWRFLGFHLVLAAEKMGQTYEKTKGHTLFVFDNEDREEARFTDLILRPPQWSDEYYGRSPKIAALEHIVDVPYFGDSKDVGLIQLADFVSFFLRRFAEITSGSLKLKYKDEEDKVKSWIGAIRGGADTRFTFPKKGRNRAQDLFYRNAPEPIRNL